MKRLRSFGSFWYDFVVGDDWRLALASGVALGACGLLSHANLTSWWIVPGVVVLTLGVTLARLAPPAPDHRAPVRWTPDDGVPPIAEVDE